MREIKFRAWHNRLKRMFLPEEMAGDQLCLLPTGRFINCHSIKSLSKVYTYAEMLPLQFTGLLDRGGVEIYEGDIVVIGEVSGDKVPAIVKFGEGTITVCGYDDHNDYNYWGWYLDGLIDCDQELKIGNDIKVIGNVYENPELAEGIK